MAGDPRKRWPIFSGLTRQEQRVLVFLIVVIGAGLAYQQYEGNWRGQTLVLHRGRTGAGGPSQPTGPVRATPGNAGTPANSGATADALLDINKATAGQLETLPGIGPVRAGAIIRSRQERGAFQSIEDLKRVSGIGDKTVENIRPYLQPLDDPTTQAQGVTEPPVGRGGRPTATPTPPTPNRPAPINLNTATPEELSALDGIGSVLAGRIVEYRRIHGPFRRAVDIQKVEGIGPRTYEKNRRRITVGPPGR